MAAGVVRELVTSWGFDVDEKPLKKMDEAISKMKSKLNVMIGAATGAAAALFGFAKFTADSRIELSKTSKEIGVNVEKLKELHYASKMSEVDAGALDLGLKLLSRTAFAAAEGSEEQAKAFGMLGVSVRDQMGHLKSSDELLLEISGKFAAMPDGIKKTALALRFFGRSGASLIPFLDKGPGQIMTLMKESRSFGVIDDKKIHQAEEFEHAIVRMGAAMRELRNAIGGAAMGPITDMINAFNEWIKVNKEWIKTQIVEKLGFLANNVRLIIGLFAALVGIKIGLVFLEAAAAVGTLVTALGAAVIEASTLSLLLGGLPLLMGLLVGGAAYLSTRGNSGVFKDSGQSMFSSGVDKFMASGQNKIELTNHIHVTAPAGSDPKTFGTGIAEVIGPLSAKTLRETMRDVAPTRER